MDLGFKDFRLIAVLAEEGHFGRAAERLNMRQPQLSIRLARIEDRLGFPLFHRRPRVSATVAAATIIEAARKTQAEFDAAVARARRLASGQSGSVVTAVASSVMLSDLPVLLNQFRRQWPDVALELVDMHSRDQGDALRRRLIDLAITREPIAEPAISTEVLGYQRFVALLPADHPLAAETVIAPRQLAGEPFVLFSSGIAPGLLAQINALCLRAGFVPTVGQSAQEWYTTLGFVRAGYGVTIALDIFMDALPSGIVARPLDDPLAVSPVFLCWHQGQPSPQRDFLIEWLLKHSAEINPLEKAAQI